MTYTQEIIDGLQLFIDPRDDLGLKRFKTYEPIETAFWKAVIREKLKNNPKCSVIDVGANIGWYTLQALRLGCKVYAFEPMDLNFELMNLSIAANNYKTDMVHTFKVALGNKEEIVPMVDNETLSGNGTIYKTNAVKPPFWGEIFHLTDSVFQVKTLDSFEIPEINLMKIDVEGYEPYVLEGMKNHLANNQHLTIFMEFFPDLMVTQGADPEKFFNHMLDLGFSAQAIGPIKPSTQLLKSYNDFCHMKTQYGRLYLDVIFER